LILRPDKLLADNEMQAFVAGLPGQPAPDPAYCQHRPGPRLARLAGGREAAVRALLGEVREAVTRAFAATAVESRGRFVSVRLPAKTARINAYPR